MSDESPTPFSEVLATIYPNDVPAPVADVTAARKPDDSATAAKAAPSPEVPASDAAVEPVAGPPEKYELALKGLDLDPGLVAQAEPVFRGLGLSNEQANALLPLAPKIIEKAESALVQRIIDGGTVQRKAWADSFSADKEIGGAQRSESARLAGKGLEALGFGKDHPFRATLNETGFGNHPDMIRAFRRIGELVGADGRLPGGRSAARGNVPVWEAAYRNR